MCYSKEVSLLSGSIIAVSSGYSYWKYVFHRARNKVKKELVPAFLAIIVGMSFIGVHQFSEFFAILTGNQVIYKIGLIFSISAMYFILRSLEHLTHTKLGSRVFLVVIGVIAVDIMSRDMVFENVHFWVRGYSHVLWASAWMALFIYWNVAVVYLRKVTIARMNRKLLFWYAFAVIDLSFLLSLLYIYGSALVQRSGAANALLLGHGLSGALQSIRVIQDSASIWCVFAAIQAITIPIFFFHANRSFNVKSPIRVRSVSMSTKARLIMWSAGIWILFFLSLPVFHGVALKMIFK